MKKTNIEIIQELKGVIYRMSEITRNSHGVSGWHRNGDIALWEEIIEPEDLKFWR